MEVLQTCGYKCDQACSVSEALIYLEQQPYTCVLTDLIMPEQSGLDLLQDVVSSHPDIAVILVSGQNDTAQVRRALKSGAYDYLEAIDRWGDCCHRRCSAQETAAIS